MIDLESVQFVIGKDGHPVAVQVEVDLWRRILEALEDAEDVDLARQALAELDAAGGDPEKAEWKRLESLRAAWEAN